jgi:hypothetical protein
MTSKALKRLANSEENYDLSIDVMTTGKQGEIGVKAILTLFKPGVDGKPGVTSRRTVGIGIANSLTEAKNSAVEDALLAAGV